MVFETLTNLVERHKAELSQVLAQEILNYHLSSYAQDSQETLATKAVVTLDIVIRYLHTSLPY